MSDVKRYLPSQIPSCSYNAPEYVPASDYDTLLKEVKARLADADALIAKGLAVVHDFLPNIGRCVLQDYQRMNEFCVQASARAADSAGEKP